MALAHSTLLALDVDGLTILHMINPWSRKLTSYSLQDWVRCTLCSVNVERPVADGVCPNCTWLPWGPLLPPIYELHWLYSWIDRFVRSAMSRYNLLGNFLYTWKMYSWYLGELVHPQNSNGELNIPVAFLMESPATLKCMSAVSQLIFSEQFGMGYEWYFWSNQWEAFMASRDSPPEAINTIRAYNTGS